ncbi:GNAT family protein [Streptomyces sp. SP17BM10]|uniref:GNAT family N-acetyltransferase n=1 Tax=Streptomyces sp. SP17BM10 TaxID=3002530 RepID=UPI002E7A141D|nr:GNAT family protein [Streptomyces sp. SP17BM10]MEE1784197.1 GNAT family protein [Streptomyces sp. SP17BM10]
MVPVRLTGPRLAIREYRHTPEELDALHALFGDPEVTRYLPFEPRDREDCADQLALYLEGAMEEERDTYRLAVTLHTGPGADDDPADAPPIGQAALTVGPYRSAELGYVLRRDVWGYGYGSEIARLLCVLAFDRLGLHRLAASVDVDNTASVRVLGKLGFQREGRIRHDVLKGGIWSDSYLYSLLADEWRGSGTGETVGTGG